MAELPVARGRPKPVMHDARHTFGSMLIREGEDDYSVSGLISRLRPKSKPIRAPLLTTTGAEPGWTFMETVASDS